MRRRPGSRSWVELTLTTTIIGPIVGALGVVVGLTDVPYAEPYWLDLSSKATGSFILLAPGLAAVSAWDAGRWRVLATLPVRSWARLWCQHLLIVAAITLVTFTLTLAVLAAQITPRVGVPRLDVLLTGVFMVVAYASVGFVLGRLLPRLVAAPVTFAAVWFWVACTPSVQPFWLRNVNGNLAASCCSVDAELVDKALLAPTVIGAALLVGSVAIARGPRSTTAWVLAAVVIASATAVASTWMAHVGADPVEVRRGEQTCVQHEVTTWCAWPEHASTLDEAADQLSAAAARLRTAGLDVPTRLAESTASTGEGWTFSLTGPTSGAWLKGFATSPLSSLPPPCIADNGGLWPAGDSQPLVTAWLEVISGAAGPEVAARDVGADPVELSLVLHEPRSDQVAWYRTMRQALDGCEPMP